MNSFRRGEPNRYRTMDLPTWELIRTQESDPIKVLTYYWFGPLSTPFGILRAPDGYTLADLGWKAIRLRKARAALEASDLLWRDGEIIVIVPFLACNAPPNGNVVIGWTRLVAILPDSPLFEKLYERASEWLTPEGLAFLSPKLKTPIETISKPFPNHSETVREYRGQGSGVRKQGSESRMQGAGDRMQGVQGGEGQGEEPAAALRSASPREAASLRAASSRIDQAVTFARTSKLGRNGTIVYLEKAGLTVRQITKVLSLAGSDSNGEKGDGTGGGDTIIGPREDERPEEIQDTCDEGRAP